MNTRRIFVASSLSRGSFSGEVVFKIDAREGSYVGVAPVRDCRSTDAQPITYAELPANGDYVPGMLVARLIANGGDVARVALPDGEAVHVHINQVSERESEIAHVSV